MNPLQPFHSLAKPLRFPKPILIIKASHSGINFDRAYAKQSVIFLYAFKQRSLGCKLQTLHLKILQLNCFSDKTLSLGQTRSLQKIPLRRLKNYLLMQGELNIFVRMKMDAKDASGMDVSYLKSFEKKYSFDFEVSK